MPIIQTSNKPIVLEVDMDLTDATSVEVHITDRRDDFICHFDKTEITIEGKTIKIPVTQELTANWPSVIKIAVKAMVDGQTEFFDDTTESVCPWHDKTVMT